MNVFPRSWSLVEATLTVLSEEKGQLVFALLTAVSASLNAIYRSAVSLCGEGRGRPQFDRSMVHQAFGPTR